MKTTYNYLRPHAFKMVIKDAPGVAFAIQRASIPGIIGDRVDTENPFISVPHLYDKILHTNTTLEFIVSEDLDNYLQIYDWMIAIGFPTDRSMDYAKKVKDLNARKRGHQDSLISDISLIIMDSDHHELATVDYLDAFPVNLSPMDMDIRQTEFQYMTASVEFVFRTFSIVVN